MAENEGGSVATAEQARERIAYLRERNRCVSCTKQDAFTLIGKPRCAECAEKHAEMMRLYRQRKRIEVNQRKKEQYKERSEAGKCVKCGRKIDREGKKTCSWCAVKQREVDGKRVMNKDRGRNGMCWTCNKEPHEPGEKLCKACHEKMSMVAIENQKYINREEHIWRKSEHERVLEIMARSSRQTGK